MLVLSRKHRESVVIGGGSGFERVLKVTVLEITGNNVKLGFEADADIPVHRLEIWERMCASGELRSGLAVPTLPVVEDLDVLEQSQLRLLAPFEGGGVDEFLLER